MASNPKQNVTTSNQPSRPVASPPPPVTVPTAPVAPVAKSTKREVVQYFRVKLSPEDGMLSFVPTDNAPNGAEPLSINVNRIPDTDGDHIRLMMRGVAYAIGVARKSVSSDYSAQRGAIASGISELLSEGYSAEKEGGFKWNGDFVEAIVSLTKSDTASVRRTLNEKATAAASRGVKDASRSIMEAYLPKSVTPGGKSVRERMLEIHNEREAAAVAEAANKISVPDGNSLSDF